MTPTLSATFLGEAGRSGNLSADSWHTATMELSTVNGNCGSPAFTMPAAVQVHLNDMDN